MGLQNFFPPSFTTRSYEDLPSEHWDPGPEGLVWGWDSSLPIYLSPIFVCHMWMWDQSFQIYSAPPTCLGGYVFFHSVVSGLPFISICGGAE